MTDSRNDIAKAYMEAGLVSEGEVNRVMGTVAADHLCGPENGGHAFSSHLGPGIPPWVTVDICQKCNRIEVNMSMLRDRVQALRDNAEEWRDKSPAQSPWIAYVGAYDHVLELIDGSTDV